MTKSRQFQPEDHANQAEQAVPGTTPARRAWRRPEVCDLAVAVHTQAAWDAGSDAQGAYSV